MSDAIPLEPSETDLIGKWIEEGSQVAGDPIESRIQELIRHHLQEIAISPDYGAWEVLYRDPRDERFWELTYPHGDWHGGGPRRLTNISADKAAAKYRLNI